MCVEPSFDGCNSCAVRDHRVVDGNGIKAGL